MRTPHEDFALGLPDGYGCLRVDLASVFLEPSVGCRSAAVLALLGQLQMLALDAARGIKRRLVGESDHDARHGAAVRRSEIDVVRDRCELQPWALIEDLDQPLKVSRLPRESV